MTFEVVVLGSSGSGPAPGNPASGYLVRTPGTTLWMEAGPGTFMALADLIDPADVSAVAVSHLHPDHSADLLGLAGYLAHRVRARRRTPLFLPRGGPARLQAYLGGGEHDTLAVLGFDEVDDGDTRTVGDLSLRFAATAHPVPTVAMRIESGGRSLAFSGDTGPGGGFPGLAAGADVVLCEAALPHRDGDGGYPYHLTPGEAGALAAAAGARRLVLTHLGPEVIAARALTAAAERFGGAVAEAVLGLRIEV